jgi:hypothetical protein
MYQKYDKCFTFVLLQFFLKRNYEKSIYFFRYIAVLFLGLRETNLIYYNNQQKNVELQ